MRPSIGRIVHVRLTDDCAKAIGGNARAGDPAPAIITEVLSEECINVIIFGDGPGAPLWSTSLMQGGDIGQWRWPERIE